MKSETVAVNRVSVFLDTSALFAAVYSGTGGAREILRLGEMGAIKLWVGPHVLKEAENVVERKSPKSKAYFALLLDRSRITITQDASKESLDRALSVIGYLPDAQVLAEAIDSGMDYFVSFDRKHLIGNPKAKELPFPMGTAGDFLGWFRVHLAVDAD